MSSGSLNGANHFHLSLAADFPRRENTLGFKARIEKGLANQDEAKLKEVCQEFEAIFLQMLWKQMRRTVPQSGFLGGNSHIMQTYWDLLEGEYCREMARSPGNLGLGEMLYRQLLGHQKSSE